MTKIETTTKELLELLVSLEPGLASKEILEQTKCFIFTQGWVCTYNDRIMVQRPLPFDFDGDCAVNAGELLKLLSAMPEQALTLEFTDSHLCVNGRRSKTKVPLQLEIQLPVNEIQLPEQYEDLPGNFKEALNFCLFSCAKDMTFPVLTCLCVDGRQVVSSDNVRATQISLSEDMPLEEPILLPYYVVQQLVHYSIMGIGVDRDWIHFLCAEDVVFSSRVVEGEYPDVKELFKEKKSMRTFTLPEEQIVPALERAQIFSKVDISVDEHVSIRISDGFLFITGQGDKGEHQERIKLKDKGCEVSFGIHPSFLRQIIDRGSHTFKEDGNRLLVKGADFVHVALLYVGEV